MKIAVFGNNSRPSIYSHLKRIFDFFENRSVDLFIDTEIFEWYIAERSESPKKFQLISNDDFEVDLALSLGGDGTFLTTAARVGNKNIPILGINTGRLGFLADVSTEEIEAALENAVNHKLCFEERTLLEVKINDGRTINYPCALNDVSILKQDSSSMISIKASLNGEPIHTYQADGLVVSTPTGSTAYSMSVGGPLMVPSAQNIILSPIASHSLNVRPLVIPDDWEIDLMVQTRTNHFQVSIDGRMIVLEEGIKVHIKKADYTIKAARQPDRTFFDTLKSKLMWGIDKRN